MLKLFYTSLPFHFCMFLVCLAFSFAMITLLVGADGGNCFAFSFAMIILLVGANRGKFWG